MASTNRKGRGRRGAMGTIQDLADDSGMAPSSVRDVILRGLVPHVRFGNSRYRVLWADWDALIKRLRETGVR